MRAARRPVRLGPGPWAVLAVTLAACDTPGAPDDADAGLDAALDARRDVLERAPPSDAPVPGWDALPDPADASLPPECSWTDVQNRILPTCLGFGCHDDPGAAGLALDPAHAYAALVGVPSSTVPSVLRVRPGDPDESFLWRKLTGRLPGDLSQGQPMPRDEGDTDWLQLSPDDQRLVYCWILQGAAAQ